MSLHDELVTEAEYIAKSQIDDFMATLSPEDLDEVQTWIKDGGSKAALHRVLKRRGLGVADSTFRNWVNANVTR